MVKQRGLFAALERYEEAGSLREFLIRWQTKLSRELFQGEQARGKRKGDRTKTA